MKRILLSTFVLFSSTSAFPVDMYHNKHTKHHYHNMWHYYGGPKYQEYYEKNCQYVWGAHFCTSPPRPCIKTWLGCV